MTSGFSQEKSGTRNKDENTPGKKEQTEMLINSRDFVFQARRAIPSQGNSVDLTTNRSYIIFNPDFIESYMPFFGRAYSGVGYGSDTGLHFRGQPENFTVEKRKKNYQVSVTVKGETDNFRLFLTVSQDGTASLTINSNNRQAISYIGDIIPPGKTEKR